MYINDFFNYELFNYELNAANELILFNYELSITNFNEKYGHQQNTTHS